MPSFVIADVSIPVVRVELRLSLGGGPLLSLLLEQGAAPPDNARLAVWEGRRARLQDADVELEFSILGVTRGPRIPSSSKAKGVWVYGLALELDTQNWLSSSVNGVEDYDWLLYQRNDQQDGWQFSNLCFAGKINQPPNYDSFDDLFFNNSILVRHSSWTHFRFLQELAVFLNCSKLCHGFYLVNDDQQPIYLSSPSQAFELNQRWLPKLDLRPSLYAGEQWTLLAKELTASFELAESTSVSEIFDILATSGPQNHARRLLGESLVDGQDALLLAPRPILFRDQEWPVKAVSFVWDGGQALTSVLELGSVAGLRESMHGPALPRLKSEFVAWVQARDGETDINVRAAPESRWALVEDDHPNPNLELCVQALIPCWASEQGVKGLYVRYEEGDPLEVLASHGQQPCALGSVHSHNQELEAKALSLSGAEIALVFEESLEAGLEGEILAARGDNVSILDGSIKVEAGEVTVLDNVRFQA